MSEGLGYNFDGQGLIKTYKTSEESQKVWETGPGERQLSPDWGSWGERGKIVGERAEEAKFLNKVPVTTD